MRQERIRPFYVFNRNDKYYIINIEKMSSTYIDETVAEILKRIDREPDKPLDKEEKYIFNKLELIENYEDKNKYHNNKSFPVINIALFLTQSCNLDCIYCYGGSGKYGTGGILEEKIAYQAVDWLITNSGKVKKLHISFFGGEPFLNFPVMKAVTEYARKKAGEMGKEVNFHLTTNGTLLDTEQIEFIKENMVSVTVSFDGPKEVQDLQRPFLNGKGTYDFIVPKIKKLLEIMPKTSGHAVVAGDTELHLIKQSLREIGFSEISLTPVSESFFGNKSRNPIRDLEEMLKEIEIEAEKWVKYTKSRNSKLLKAIISDGQLYQAVISILHNSKKYYPCGAGLGLVAVSCSGDIFLCHRFVGMDEYKLGNIFNDDFDRGKYLDYPLKYMEKCSICFAKYYCSGGCKHDNITRCGSLFKPSQDMCFLKSREFELAAYINSEFEKDDFDFLVKNEILPEKPCPFDFF